MIFYVVCRRARHGFGIMMQVGYDKMYDVSENGGGGGWT